jgi:phage-related tail protein
MANKARLTATAERIGTAVGRAERTVRKVGEAAKVAREELTHLTKRIEALGRELKKSSERLKRSVR